MVSLITGCTGTNNSSTNTTQNISRDQGFVNGGFEEGNGTGAYYWNSTTICGIAPCVQRIKTVNDIDGYSLDIKAVAANNTWNELIKTKTPELDTSSTTYTLEFDFNCVTATTSWGWHMFFRDANRPCCIDAATEGIAYYTNGTTANKHMKTFMCSAGEKGHYVATFTTLPEKNTNYYWHIYAWINTTNNEEIIVDNFKLYKTTTSELLTSLKQNK